MKPNPRNDYIKLCQRMKRPKNIDFGREYDKLLKHKLIKNIEINGNGILVSTRKITIKYKRRAYALGEFEILLEIDLDFNKVTFKNLTNPIIREDKEESKRIYHHPHIRDYFAYDENADEYDYDGQDACFGNIKDLIDELLDKEDIPGLIYLCLNFLQSYQGHDYTDNEGDDYEAYKEITYWPLVKKPKIKKRKR